MNRPLLTSCDIAIVGGGMAGSSLALLLAQQIPQQQVVLVEALAAHSAGLPLLPSYDDRSSALSLGSCRIFQSLKLWDKLVPYLEAINKVHVSDRGHPAGTLLDAQQMPSRDGDLGYVIENRNLGAVLLEAVQENTSITLYDNSKVEVIHPHANYVALQLQNGHTLQCQLLVIADGAESPLRAQLGISVDRKPYHQAAVIANITTSTFHQHIAYERFTDYGPMALLPLQDFSGEHRCALVWTIPEDFSASVSKMTDEEFLRHIQQRFGQRLGFFTRVGKRNIYPLALIKSREQIRRRIVLMGNAAHNMHPVAGQGFNLSLRDCLVLAETLKGANSQGQDIGRLQILEHYLEQRRPDQQKTIGTSHLLTLLFSTDDLPFALLRNTGLMGLNFLPGMKNWFARHAMGLTGRSVKQ